GDPTGICREGLRNGLMATICCPGPDCTARVKVLVPCALTRGNGVSPDVVNWRIGGVCRGCARAGAAVPRVRRGRRIRPGPEVIGPPPCERRAAVDDERKVARPCNAAMMPHGRGTGRPEGLVK